MELSILNLLLVLLAAWVAGSIVAKLGYPAIFGELLAGIVLGPPLLGLLEASDTLSVLAEVGVLLMMLYIGMEIDPKELFKASWGGFLAAIGGFVTPFALAYIVVVPIFGGTTMAGLFVGIAAGVTSLATKSRILADLNLLDTRIAHVLMAGALVADSLSLIVFAGIISVMDLGTLEITQLISVGGEVVVFFGVAIFLGLKVFPIAWEYLAKLGLTSRTFYATFLLLITLLFAEMAELAGLHAILGAFLAGLFIREGVGVERRLAGELTELVRDVSIGFLAPIFFVTAGFQVDLNVFVTSLPLLITVTLAATLGKVIGTTVFYLLSGNGWREGVVIGAGMNGRGAVEIIIAEIALTSGIISQEIFSVLVFMAIFTTATVPVFLKWGTDWLRSRGELTRAADHRTGVVIMGTGNAARALARELKSAYPVSLIDNNRDRTKQAREEGLDAFYGDALNVEHLQEVSLGEARWFLALTPNTEINILAAQIARKSFNVPEILVLSTRSEEGTLQSMLTDISARCIDDRLVNVTAWDQYSDLSEPVEPVEVEVEHETSPEAFLQKMRKENRLFLPITVMQDERLIPFFGAGKLQSGDRIKVLKSDSDM